MAEPKVWRAGVEDDDFDIVVGFDGVDECVVILEEGEVLDVEWRAGECGAPVEGCDFHYGDEAGTCGCDEGREVTE